MNLLKLANPFSPRIVENGVMSCLQASDLGIPQRIQALLLRGRARMSAGDMAGARDDLRKVLELNPEHAVATSLLSMPSSGAHAPSKVRSCTSTSPLLHLPPPSPPILRRHGKIIATLAGGRMRCDIALRSHVILL